MKRQIEPNIALPRVLYLDIIMYRFEEPHSALTIALTIGHVSHFNGPS
jgi:hypothetical protein